MVTFDLNILKLKLKLKTETDFIEHTCSLEGWFGTVIKLDTMWVEFVGQGHRPS